MTCDDHLHVRRPRCDPAGTRIRACDGRRRGPTARWPALIAAWRSRRADTLGTIARSKAAIASDVALPAMQRRPRGNPIAQSASVAGRRARPGRPDVVLRSLESNAPLPGVGSSSTTCGIFISHRAVGVLGFSRRGRRRRGRRRRIRVIPARRHRQAGERPRRLRFTSLSPRQASSACSSSAGDLLLHEDAPLKRALVLRHHVSRSAIVCAS